MRATRAMVGGAFLILALVAGCDRPDDIAAPTVAGPPENARVYPVETHASPAATIDSGMTDDQGRPVGIGCMTCHSLRDTYVVPEDVDGLGSFHGGMAFSHGELSCRACHDHERADRLRLADGTSVEMAESIRLCSQCHGPQASDWEHGSHGGMRGHWDRRRGPATRNHCVDCHDPHVPTFPSFLPAPPPRDRFLSEAGGHDG